MTKRLMIVDDSPVMRSFVRRTLLIAGLEMESCAEAANGAEALEKLGGAGVDLILTDINMPVLDGEGLLRALQADPELKLIPVVVVSTDSTDQRVDALMGLGARGYVKKPFHPEKLSEVLSDIFPEWAGAVEAGF
jgi:two-component system chemotaxis response regulator CheY